MQHINPELIERYHSGNCSPEERAIVEKWLQEETELPEMKESNAFAAAEHLEKEIWNSIEPHLAGREKDKKGHLRKLWIRTVAAACVIGLLAAGAHFVLTEVNVRFAPTGEITQMKTVEVAPGKRSRIQLADSTIVHLMGGSKLSFPEKFPAGCREINLLQGEAFLEVHHDEHRPFTIHSGHTAVRVLGTKFNIRNRGADSLLQVVLTEGSILFSAENSTQQLVPGEELLYNKVTQSVKAVNQLSQADEIASWTKGVLRFKAEPLKKVLSRLEQFYGIHFKYDSNINLNVPFTATVENLSLEKTLSLMSFSTSLKFLKQDKIVIITE